MTTENIPNLTWIMMIVIIIHWHPGKEYYDCRRLMRLSSPYELTDSRVLISWRTLPCASNCYTEHKHRRAQHSVKSRIRKLQKGSKIRGNWQRGRSVRRTSHPTSRRWGRRNDASCRCSWNRPRPPLVALRRPRGRCTAGRAGTRRGVQWGEAGCGGS